MDTMELIVLVVLSIIITVVITRWLFRINTMVKTQQAQLYILTKIAEKHGVDNNEILSALNHARGAEELSAFNK